MPCACKYCNNYNVYTLRIVKSIRLITPKYYFNKVNMAQYYDLTNEQFNKQYAYMNVRTYMCSACSITDCNLIVDKTKIVQDGFVSSKNNRVSNDRYTCANCKSGNVYEIIINNYNINVIPMNKSTNKSIIAQDFKKSGFINPVKWLKEVYYCPGCNNISSTLEWFAIDEDKYLDAPWIRELDYYSQFSEDDCVHTTDDTDNNSDMYDLI